MSNKRRKAEKKVFMILDAQTAKYVAELIEMRERILAAAKRE